MNKNLELVEFDTIDTFGITEIKNEKRLSKYTPLGYVNIATWIENRNYAKHKEHMKRWLKEWGIDTVDGFIQITHCLGLNDTFWVKPVDSDLKWEKVNLYDNDFTDVACKTAFETGLYGLQLSTTTPEFTTDGTFPKCWIKNETGIHILKQGLSGASNTGNEPYSEYVSSNICNKIFDDVIAYDLVMYKNKICSICELFTTQQIGYIPFGRYADSTKYYTIPGLIEYFKQYDQDKHTDFEYKFRKMILMDSIVFNMDRHLNNFGLLFDTDSLQILDFAPIFDFNFSFLTTMTIDDLKNYRESLVKYDIGHKLGGDFQVVGHEILTSRLKSQLPSHISIPMHDKYNMDSERMSLLNEIFEQNYTAIIQ
jgi:hypothetical protein